MSEHYIIEHPKTGVFIGWEWNNEAEWKPRFAWSIHRYEARMFDTRKAAESALARISAPVSECEIMEI